MIFFNISIGKLHTNNQAAMFYDTQGGDIPTVLQVTSGEGYNVDCMYHPFHVDEPTSSVSKILIQVGGIIVY